MASNKRQSGETIENYRARLAHEKLISKYKSRGKLLWNTDQHGQFLRGFEQIPVNQRGKLPIPQLSKLFMAMYR